MKLLNIKRLDEVFWTWIIVFIILFIATISISSSNNLAYMVNFLYVLLYVNMMLGSFLLLFYFKIESDIKKARGYLFRAHKKSWTISHHHNYTLKGAGVWFGLCAAVIIISYIMAPNIIHSLLVSLIAVLTANGYVMAVLVYNYFEVHEGIYVLLNTIHEPCPIKRKAKSHKIDYLLLEDAGFTDLDKTKDMLDALYKI
jgi:hypothetical protein